jgi:hypothetical protein
MVTEEHETNGLSMDENIHIDKALRLHSDELAAQYSLKADRICRIAKRIMNYQFKPVVNSEWDSITVDPIRVFFDGLEQALRVMDDPEAALELFERSDLKMLFKRLETSCQLRSDLSFLHTFGELATILRTTLKLITENAPQLINVGLLQCTKKLPYLLRDFERLLKLGLLDDPVQGKDGITEGTRFLPLPKKLRPSVLAFQQLSLEIIIQAITEHRQPADLWTDIIQAFRSKLSPSDTSLLLYLEWGLDNSLGISPTNRKKLSAFKGKVVGGVRGVIDLVAHVFEEIEIGLCWRTRDLLDGFLASTSGSSSPTLRAEYFQLTGTPEEERLNAALDFFSVNDPKAFTFENKIKTWFLEQLQDYAKGFVKAPAIPSPAVAPEQDTTDDAAAISPLDAQVKERSERQLEWLLDNPSSENLFIRKGEFWFVALKGHNPRLAKNLVGMAYIAALLRAPDNHYSVEVIGCAKNAPFSGQQQANITHEMREEEDINTEGPTSPAFSIEDLHVLQGLILEAKLEVESSTTTMTRREAEEKLDQLKKYRNQVALPVAGAGWKPRPVHSNESTRLRSRTYKNAMDAIRHIESLDSELGSHLKQYIHISWDCYYDGRERKTWVTE